MTANAAAAGGRIAARTLLMTDACTIGRPVGPPTFNAGTGLTTPAATTPVYSGACRFKPPSRLDEQLDVGETAVYRWRWIVSVPYGTAVELNDIITCTVSQDPTLVGRTMRVRAVERGTHITAHRLHAEELSEQ
jgi:hypothetical protein